MTENSPKKGTVRDGAERYHKRHGLDEYGRRVAQPVLEPAEPDDHGTEVME